MNNLGIQEDDGGSKDNAVNNQYNELSTFIQNIYLTCKNLDVTTTFIFSWIKDLHDFHSKSESNFEISSALPALPEKDYMVDKKSLANQ